MAGSSPYQAQSTNVHQPDDFLEFECKRDWGNYQEGSVYTTHTSGSGFRKKGHVSHKQDYDKAMQ